MSQRTPEADLQLFHPACTQCFTSSSMFPLSSTMDPKYLNFCTLFSSSPSISMLPSSMLVHRYSVLGLLILILLSSNAVLHLSNFPISRPSLLSAHNTMPSAYSMLQGTVSYISGHHIHHDVEAGQVPTPDVVPLLPQSYPSLQHSFSPRWLHSCTFHVSF